MAKKNADFVPYAGSVYQNADGNRHVVFNVEGTTVKHSPEGMSHEYTTTIPEFVRDFQPTDLVNPDAESDNEKGDAKPDVKADTEEVKQNRASKARIEQVDDKPVPTDKIDGEKEVN